MGVITPSVDTEPVRQPTRPESDPNVFPQRRSRRLSRRSLVLLIVLTVVVALGVVLVERLERGPVVASDATPTATPGATSPTTPQPNVLFAANYSESSVSATAHTGWRSEQEPRTAGVGAVQTERITVVTGADVPGTGPAKPSGALRVELKPYESTPGARDGDVTVTSGYAANRAEVFGRYPGTPATGTPATDWPDPIGSERWYSFALLVPVGFQFATDSNWIVITQWKGLRGGSPPVSLEIKRGALRLGGTRTNSRLIPNDGNLGKIVPGTWTELTVGLGLSTDSTQGWVDVYRDGEHIMPRTAMATMDIVKTRNGPEVDPIYLKQGIYRARSWKTDATVYFGPMVVTRTR